MKRMRTRECLLFIIIICMITVPVSGLAGEYRLGVGDVLQISVWGHEELATTVEVRPDGYITFPLVGDVWAVERTTQDLTREIQASLEDYVVEPRVTVIVSKFRTLQVQVLGEVKSPGYYELKASSRLMDVLGAAGGPTKEADLSNVTITRHILDPSSKREQAEVVSVNVSEFLKTGAVEANQSFQRRCGLCGCCRKSVDFRGCSSACRLRYNARNGYSRSPCPSGGALDTADLEQVVLTRQERKLP